MGFIRGTESFSLWTSPTCFWLESADKSIKVVSISRSLSPIVTVAQGSIPTSATRRTVHGILGVIELPLATFLVVVTRKSKVGELAGHAIWRLEMVDFLPIASRSAEMTAEIDAHKRCLTLIRQALATPYFYFSYSGDLTNTQQRQEDRSDQADPWQLLDSRFIWNQNLLDGLLSGAVDHDTSPIRAFLVPIIHGAIFIQRTSINGKPFIWSLISRRSRFQTGTRFFARGTDSNGNVANFCETEQIVEYKGQIASHVQTRGSMPFLWSQTPSIKYMPDPVINGNPEETKAVMKAHFMEQMSFYGDQVAVNLVNQKKNEGRLEKYFRDLVASIGVNGVYYEPFDFHKECSKMRYDRLVLLSEQLSTYRFGYFHKASAGNSRQTGVFRSNCMDCLDRTNVVQAYLAAETLALILARMGVLQSNSVTEMEQNVAFRTMYRHSWADHANLISVQYAGTGALKTDYTRTGVRTHWGLLQDGWNSAIRYVKNNFMDGQRTDAIKFLLGELRPSEVVSEAKKKQVDDHETNMVVYIPHTMLVFTLVFTFTMLTSSKFSFSTFFLCLLSFGMIYVLFKLMVANSKEFVNFPTLFEIKRK